MFPRSATNSAGSDRAVPGTVRPQARSTRQLAPALPGAGEGGAAPASETVAGAAAGVHGLVPASDGLPAPAAAPLSSAAGSSSTITSVSSAETSLEASDHAPGGAAAAVSSTVSAPTSSADAPAPSSSPTNDSLPTAAAAAAAASESVSAAPVLPAAVRPLPPSLPAPPLLPGLSANVPPDPSASSSRTAKFARLFDAKTVDMDALRKLCWLGVPRQYRIHAWQLLLGYLPSSRDRHASSVDRKRADYRVAVSQSFGAGSGGLGGNDKEQALLRQVLVDVPRTCPGIALFHTEFVQRSLERVLFVWALRHPASGYVQGINDLATPLYAVFLEPYLAATPTAAASVAATAFKGATAAATVTTGAVVVPASSPTAAAARSDALLAATDEQLFGVEADVYWCLSRILDGILDHYTPSQPGLQRLVFRLQELINRVDAALSKHVSALGLEFMQFAFRWMNCKLLRELPFPVCVRMWDTYFSVPGGFEDFHVYVCTALLLRFSASIKAMASLEDVVLFLQKLPTTSWGVNEIEEVLSQAYIYQTAFQAAPSHFG